MIPLAWRIGGALALAGTAAGGAWWWGVSKYSAGEAAGRAAERAIWERSVAEAGERFAAALADQQQALARTETALQRSRREASRRQEGLADAVQRDPVAAEWAAGRVPDSVRVYLGGAGDPAVPRDPGDVDAGLRAAGP
ncbi:MAG: hypothetical protein H6826_13575 [Planctomycetes bacterium]|nr:hypothetical protein [Planctomycetota bacterium]